MQQIIRVTVVFTMALLMGACASSNSGGVYQRGEARQIQTVKTGVVESVRQVKLEGTKTPIGGGAGAVVGGVAGSTVGGAGSIGISAADNDITNTIKAYVDGSKVTTVTSRAVTCCWW